MDLRTDRTAEEADMELRQAKFILARGFPLSISTTVPSRAAILGLESLPPSMVSKTSESHSFSILGQSIKLTERQANQ